MFQLSLSPMLREHLAKVAQSESATGQQQPKIFDASMHRLGMTPGYAKNAEADNVLIFHGREVRQVPDAAAGEGCVMQLSLANAADPEGWTEHEIGDYNGWAHDSGRPWRRGSQLEEEGCAAGEECPALDAAVSLIQKSVKRSMQTRTPKEHAAAGTVDGLYTAGSGGPGPVGGPVVLRNYLSDDGCFAGIRMMAVNSDGGTDVCSDNGRTHPMMDTLLLAAPGQEQGPLQKCSEANAGDSEQTEDGQCGASVLHFSYGTHLHALSAEKPHGLDIESLEHMWEIMHLTNGAAKPLADYAETIGMRLVGRAMNHESAESQKIMAAYGIVPADSADLIQKTDDLSCVVAFRATDSMNDALRYQENMGETSFCGFDGIYDGYVDYIKTVMTDEWKTSILSKLPKCSKVVAIGHSLGGSTAGLFAACVNRAPTGEGSEDYSLMKWTKATPELMDGV